MGKRIYLAGKIAPGDWRHTAVPRLREAMHADDGPWSTLKAAVLTKFDYVGPFFISCDHGGFHGPASHGVGAGGTDCCESVGLHRSVVAQRCMDAIERADLFYAWLDDLTAFGTLAEIGYASGRARQHSFPIIVATPVGGNHEHDLWFSLQLYGVSHIRSTSPVRGLRDALVSLKWI